MRTVGDRGGFCSRCAAWFVRVGFYYSICLGVTELCVDFEQQKVRKRKWHRVVAAAMTLVQIVLVPFGLVECFHRNRRDLNDNEFAQYTGMAQQFILYAVMLATVVLRRWRDHAIETMAYEYFALDIDYFDRQPMDAALERRFYWRLLAKALVTVGQQFVVFNQTMQVSRTVGAHELFWTLHAANVYNVVHNIMYYYYFSLWSAEKRFTTLNMRLQQLLETLRLHHGDADVLSDGSQTRAQLWRLATAELHELAAVHLRLTKLCACFSANNQCQLLGMLLTNAINVLTFGYYSILIMDGSFDFRPTLGALLSGTVAYGILCVDLQLFYSACSGMTDAQQATAKVLQEFRELPRASVAFEQQSELFATQLLHRKLTINVNGMFSVTMESSLSLWIFLLRHTVILVQFDHENKERRLREGLLQAHNEDNGLL